MPAEWFAASGDLFSPAVAGSADTAATAADCGRTDTLSMKALTFPAETMLETAMRFSFSGGSCKIPFLLVFFSARAKVGEYATVDRTEAMQGTRFQSFGHRLLSRRGSQWALFNRKVRNPTHGLRIGEKVCVSSFSSLAVIGLSRERPCRSEGGAPCRQLPPRLERPTTSTIPSACHSVLLRNASLSKPKQVQPRSR